MPFRLSSKSILTVVFLAAGTVPAVADTVRIGGTGGATALMMYLGKPFMQRTGIAVEVVPSLGSGGGNKAVADGVLDLSVIGRTLSETEMARGLTETARIRTPFVFATSNLGPVGMTEREILSVYANPAAAWPDGMPVKLIMRPVAEDDNAVIASLFPGMPAGLALARQRRELPIAIIDQNNADLAEGLRGSFIGATYTQIIMEHRDLRLIAIDGVDPGMDAFESGRYRYTKVFHIIRGHQPNAATAQFTSFLTSDAGASALREAGCLPGAE